MEANATRSGGRAPFTTVVVPLIEGAGAEAVSTAAAIDSATIPSTIFSGDMSAPVGAQIGDDAAESPAKMMSSLKVVARREATSTSLSGITSLIWAASAFGPSPR